MKSRFLVASMLVLLTAGSAQAARLVVMSVNNNPGVAGYHAFTIGVQVTQADVKAGGPNAVLFVQNIVFQGSAAGPYQAMSTKGHFQNQADIQGVQTQYIDNVTSTWPPTNAALSADTGGDGITSLYRDSWWYSSAITISNYVADPGPPVSGSAGALVGFNDQAGTTVGVVTTGHTGSSPLPYTTANTTIGPTANVGSLGYLFQPEVSGVSGGATTGQDIGFTGLYGPIGNGLQFLDSGPLASQFVGGVLNVPLVQLLANGNILIPNNFSSTGTFISVGSVKYALCGSTQPTGPMILNFSNNTLSFCPEPGSIISAISAAIGICLLRMRATVSRRRRIGNSV